MTHRSMTLLFLYFLNLFSSSVEQDLPISEPRLISVDPVNSTALTVTWQFLNATFDQSDRIDISITFQEFFFSYNVTYPPINYTFTMNNKTITSVTQNFLLVNAFYVVCFTSNSSQTNSSRYLFNQQCLFKRTCSRVNASICPSASLISLSSSSISSNSFLLTIHWLKNLPYLRQTTNAQLLNSTGQGTALNLVDNETYTSFPYQFMNLRSSSTYTVNVSVSYLLFNRSFSEVQLVSVSTSRSSNMFRAGEGFCLIFLLHLLIFTNRAEWIKSFKFELTPLQGSDVRCVDPFVHRSNEHRRWNLFFSMIENDFQWFSGFRVASVVPPLLNCDGTVWEEFKSICSLG